MPQTYALDAIAPNRRSVILMARIVDATGAAVRPTTLASITYSVYEFDRCRPVGRIVVPGRDDIPLDVREVFYDSLCTDGRWKVDREGYNFRHDFEWKSAEAYRRTGTQYEVRYELVSIIGPKTVVRFLLRAA